MRVKIDEYEMESNCAQCGSKDSIGSTLALSHFPHVPDQKFPFFCRDCLLNTLNGLDDAVDELKAKENPQ